NVLALRVDATLSDAEGNARTSRKALQRGDRVAWNWTEWTRANALEQLRMARRPLRSHLAGRRIVARWTVRFGRAVSTNKPRSSVPTSMATSLSADVRGNFG